MLFKYRCLHFPPSSPPVPPILNSHPQSYPPLALSVDPLYIFLGDPSLFSSCYPLPPRLWLLSVCSLFQCLCREREREGERERNINVWLPLMCPLLGTCPTTQAWALTGNWISNPLVRRPALNPLSRTSQGESSFPYLCQPSLPLKWNCIAYTVEAHYFSQLCSVALIQLKFEITM